MMKSVQRHAFDADLFETQLALVAHGVVLGVDVHFLTGILPKYVESKFPERTLTTQEVVNEIVQPLVAECKTSLLPMLLGFTSKKYGPLVSEASIFVSHTWKATFDTLHTGLRNHSDQLGAAGIPYYWVDVMCKPQSTIQFSLDEFHDTISSTGTTLVILDGISDALALRRVWCLFEMSQTISLKSQLSMQLSAGLAMSPSERTLLETAYRLNGVTVEEAEDAARQLGTTLAKQVAVEYAVATYPQDIEKIHAEIKKSVGFETVNTRVKIALAEMAQRLTVSFSQA